MSDKWRPTDFDERQLLKAGNRESCSIVLHLGLQAEETQTIQPVKELQVWRRPG